MNVILDQYAARNCELTHIKLDVAPPEGVGLTCRHGALPWPVQEKHGHVDDPLEAIALVVILSMECRKGVMYQPIVNGFEPLQGPI